MDAKQINEITDKYITELENRGWVDNQMPNKSLKPDVKDALSHVLWMLYEIQTFAEANNLEKANRWLGFVQGILWVRGIYSIQQMMADNKSPNVLVQES